MRWIPSLETRTQFVVNAAGSNPGASGGFSFAASPAFTYDLSLSYLSFFSFFLSFFLSFFRFFSSASRSLFRFSLFHQASGWSQS